MTEEKVVDARAERLMKWLKEMASSHPDWARTPLVDYGRAQMTDLSYSVGALLFDLLYRLVGQEEFNEIVGGYYQKYAESGGSTEQFVRHAKSIATANLDQLFDDWVYSARWLERIRQAKTAEDLISYYQR